MASGKPVRIAIVGDTRDFTTSMDRAADSMDDIDAAADRASRAVEKVERATDGTKDEFGDLATNAGTLGGGLRDLGDQIGGTAGAWATATGTALEWGEIVGDIGEGLLAFIGQSKLAVIAQKTWNVITTATTAVTKGLNAAMRANPIGIIITLIALLVAGLVWFFTKTELGQKIVKTAWSGIKKAMQAVSTWWTETLVPAAQKVWSNIKKFFGKLWEFIKKVFSYSPLGLIITNWNSITKFFSGFSERVKSKFKELTSWMKGLPGRLKRALGNLKNLLPSSGRELIQGLIDGIQAMVGRVASAASNVAATIRRFLPGSPVREGPLTSWNNGGAGKRLMRFLADGISDSAQTVQRAMDRATALSLDPAGVSMSPAGAPSGAGVTIEFTGGGDDLGRALVAYIQKAVRVNGGDVQTFLGR